MDCEHKYVEWVDCYDCKDGFGNHDCGEDTCVCINPQPNVVCDVCSGNGGWWKCVDCGSTCKNVQDIGEGNVEMEFRGLSPFPKKERKR